MAVGLPLAVVGVRHANNSVQLQRECSLAGLTLSLENLTGDVAIVGNSKVCRLGGLICRQDGVFTKVEKTEKLNCADEYCSKGLGIAWDK